MWEVELFCFFLVLGSSRPWLGHLQQGTGKVQSRSPLQIAACLFACLHAHIALEKKRTVRGRREV